MFRVLALVALCLLCIVPVHAFDEDHTETINGASLHFRVRGTDKSHPYMLILHGGPGFSAHMFYGWGASVEKDVNVVYLDQRGSGQSARLHFANPYAPTPDEVQGYTIASLVGDIEGVRTFLKVDKWYVLGHSWGGMLGLEYVTAHPEHVLGYIHMDGLVSVPAVQNAILDNAEAKFKADPKANAALLVQVAQLRALPPDNPARLFGAFGLALGPAGLYFAGDQSKQFAAVQSGIAAAVKPYNIPAASLAPANEPAAALMVNDNYLTRDDTPLLAKVSVPTLIVNGRQDGVVPPAQAEAAHAAIKGSQILIVENCGHFPFAEQPALTTDAVLHFVQGKKVVITAPVVVGEMTPPDPASSGGFDNIQHPCSVGFTISEQGKVTNARIVQASGSDAFDRAAVEAIASLKFRPATQDGIAIPQRMEQTFRVGSPEVGGPEFPAPRKRPLPPVVSREADLSNVPRLRLPRHFDLKTVPNDCTVAFTIMEDGSIGEMSIKQSSGNAVFDAACAAAISKAKGLPAIQDHIPYKQRMEQTFSPH